LTVRVARPFRFRLFLFGLVRISSETYAVLPSDRIDEKILSSLPQPLHAIPLARVAQFIHEVRGKRVMLGSDPAALYGVVTWRLNEQVKRNKDRFPDDFVFQWTSAEAQDLTSQIARSKKGPGGRRTLPYAFTEHGAIMAAMVLNSPRAVEMSVLVVRAFGQMRETLSNHRELVGKLAELERRLQGHGEAISHVFKVIRRLLAPPKPKPEPPRRPIGFGVREGAATYRVGRKRGAR
jgi:hypothetical protein